tara:strand:+ start:27 stop:644 length:618 start_codon:yes stop_codon:yes gene_type:complete
MSSINYFLSKHKVFFYYLLSDYICDDLIEKIIALLVPLEDSKKLICREIKVGYNNSLYKGNRYCHSWSLMNIRTRLKECRLSMRGRINDYSKGELLPFLNNPDKTCDCLHCNNGIDYPRYMYLYSKIINKVRGENSKLTNEWFLFNYYLLLTLDSGYSFINKKDYGFSPSYNSFNRDIEIDNNYVFRGRWKTNLFRIWQKHLFIK